jgi:cytochrome c oxidase subunit III
MGASTDHADNTAETGRASHFESLARQGHAVHLGIGVLLASEVLFFGAILALIAGYRALDVEAFNAGVHHAEKTIGSVNTCVLLVSSAVVAIGIDRARARSDRAAAALLLGAACLGAVFIGLKILEYAHHINSGVLPTHVAPGRAGEAQGAHTFWALYWLATGLHALHVTVGIGALSWMAVRQLIRRGLTCSIHPLIAVGLYWHFVDVVWIFLWPLFYLA